MRKRKTSESPLAALVITIPWWIWLAFAILTELIAQALIGLKVPPTHSIATVISVSLWKGFGYFLALMGPLFCVLLAVASARLRVRSQDPAPVEREEPIWGRAPSAESTAERDLYEEWKRAGESHTPAHVDTSAWNLALLRALEWKRLEELAAVYFRTLGFRVKEAQPGPDGGVDLRLYVGASTTAGVLVQCKAWTSWKVPVKEIRELFGIMAGEGVSEGIFVTTSSFTNEATECARGKNITLIDGQDFLRKLLDLPPDDQAHILKLATSGDFTTPTCPSCGIKMVKRTAHGTGDSFWGCSQFPRCRSRIRIGRAQAAK